MGLPDSTAWLLLLLSAAIMVWQEVVSASAIFLKVLLLEAFREELSLPWGRRREERLDVVFQEE